MRRSATLAAVLIFAIAQPDGIVQGAPASAPRYMGFSAEGTRAEIKLEDQFKALISADQERAFHRYLTAEPHPAGSERNNELARWVADNWKQQGLEQVVIHRYDVLNTFPKQVVVEMVSPVKYQASLREDAYPADPDTSNPRVDSAYLGLSISGEVTAPVVYAHSGNPEDYDLLAKNGIDVRGKIVLVRYSNPYSYRGFKALTAQRHGAAGILIYSDPAEDGYKQGKVFPDGPWGPESHIQRGAITYDFIVPGDPLTPGWASVEGAKRIAPEDAQSLPKIMAVPLSWHDAKPLLENMGGPQAPQSWQGGLAIQYRLGGVAQVHMKVEMDNSVKPNYVVEARIRGSRFPDEWVVLGNHRDAWVFGGVDPSSGTASMLEMTRALGELLKKGIRPQRTLVFCNWDGEEVGLTGSTEWGEQFADELRHKMVAYLNVDSSASGPNFDPSAVASLAPLVVEMSHSLKDPSGSSLYDAWKAAALKKRGAQKRGQGIKDSEFVDTRIGSGSDHTVFLNHLGRPVMGLTFDGPYGVYHSVYDDFYWMNHFGDPGYKYHALASQLWGVLGLRLANAEVLPFDFAFYGSTLRSFVQEIQKKPGATKLQLKPVLDRISEFESEGKALNAAVNAALESGKAANLDPLNQSIMQVEGNWLTAEGIPGRPWFKHVLYAARYTYAHLELPGVTEAVEASDWPRAQQQAKILEDALARNVALLRQARAQLSATKKE